MKYLAFFFGLIFYSSNILASNASRYNCSINAPTLNFGSIIPFDYNNTDKNVRISVTCRKNPGVNGSVRVEYDLLFSPGGSGNALDRKMSNTATPSLKLKYNIYRNNARNKILGTGSNGTRIWTERYWLTNNRPARTKGRTIKGRVPIQPNAAVGTYLDTVNITLIRY